MTRYLPPNLLALFQPRPPLDYQPPISKKKMPSYSGVSTYLQYFENPKEHPPGPPLKVLTREERRAIKRKDKLEKEVRKIEEDIKSWDPHNNPKATDEAYKTLFVCRISHKTNEQTLKREFENFGPVKAVRLIHDLENKPRGYAFVEFEREKDMGIAYKEADAKKIDGYRILVDVERGRTVKDWKPRRFGGGLGGTRLGGDKDNVRFSGREAPSAGGFGAGGGGGDRFNDRGRFGGGGGRGGYGDRGGRFSGGGRDDFRRGGDERRGGGGGRDDFRRGGGEDLRRDERRGGGGGGHEDRERRGGDRGARDGGDRDRERGERRDERGHRGERGEKDRERRGGDDRGHRGDRRGGDDRHERREREDGDRKRSREEGRGERREDDDRAVRQRRN